MKASYFQGEKEVMGIRPPAQPLLPRSVLSIAFSRGIENDLAIDCESTIRLVTFETKSRYLPE